MGCEHIVKVFRLSKGQCLLFIFESKWYRSVSHILVKLVIKLILLNVFQICAKHLKDNFIALNTSVYSATKKYPHCRKDRHINRPQWTTFHFQSRHIDGKAWGNDSQ